MIRDLQMSFGLVYKQIKNAMTEVIAFKFLNLLVRQSSVRELDLANASDQVGGASTVAPFVIVPTDDFHQRAVEHFRLVGDED